MICVVCGRDVVRESDGVSRGKKVFRDDNGRRWHGRRCPQCALEMREENRDPYQRYCDMCSRAGAVPLSKDAWHALHYK